ncbi:MAG: hypothetical protein IPH93_12600 [Saprospiraceae bacterium]|nr:hypothetical protein [Saprospiraceae bacterium]MBK7812782.1 hypothetical protein [Saprospiraceae bacterium]MBK9630972.1 hypothetical protein [Saprospiraceae bacterium]
MKLFYQIVIGLYGLVSLYYIYLSAMHLFVYFSNKMNGHQESFFEPGKNLIMASVFLFFTLTSWFLIRDSNYAKLGYFVFYIPLVIIGLFVLWTLIMLIGSGGKWN